MTVENLNQLVYLRKEIEIDQRRLDEVEQWLKTAPKPFIAGLVELRDIIADKHKKCLLECERLEQFIDSIQDDYARQIFTMRYVEGRSWLQITQEFSCYASEDCYKKAVYRCIKQAEQTEKQKDH